MKLLSILRSIASVVVVLLGITYAIPLSAGIDDSANSTKASMAIKTLGGTAWRLVKIMSMDQPIIKPDNADHYTLTFSEDGRLSIRADCNQGHGGWSSAALGQIDLGSPMALTRAQCPPGSLHDRYLSDLVQVRSYAIKDGNLHLSLKGEGSAMEFEPLPH